jgi:hypothetical protein
VTGNATFQAAVANGTVMAKPVIDAAGNIYALVTTQAPPPPNGSLDQLWLIKSTDHGANWSAVSVFLGSCTTGGACAQLGLVFNDLAIDGAGNLYALTLGNAANQVSVTNPVHALLFVSTDQGATWQGPHDIGPADGNALTLPALHGGPQAGQLVLGWYHSTVSKDPSLITGNAWEYQALVSTNATANVPTFTTAVLGVTSFDATTNPTSKVHQGQVCVMGLNCTAGQLMGGGQGNRNLADFSSVTVDPTGCAIFTYADDGSILPDGSNTGGGVNNDVTRQTSGCFATLGTGLPESPLTTAVLLAGSVSAAVWFVVRRRRRAF